MDGAFVEHAQGCTGGISGPWSGFLLLESSRPKGGRIAALCRQSHGHLPLDTPLQRFADLPPVLNHVGQHPRGFSRTVRRNPSRQRHRRRGSP